ncbi:placenta-specific gene 8 protein-like [Ostrea edulis]|uniref:placenta-specific gene 8 protein-like n=1 Tax=Ostrea edulis TaxID=37623 RepID=UPI0024AF45B4|nr:placenta-specific gene 8 protein-like [Ostrea edulis]
MHSFLLRVVKMVDRSSGKADFRQQNQIQPYDQGPPQGYGGPPYAGSPGPVTGQPGIAQPYGYHSTNTTVVVAQQQVPTRPKARTWSTGICGCFEDIGSCCAVTWCGSFYMCYLSTKLGESCCLPIAIAGYGALIPLRTKIRAENNIVGSICEDCCMVCWCPLCVMCQLSREHDHVQLNQEIVR